MDRLVEIKGPYNFSQALKRLSIDPLNHIDLEKQFIKVPIVIDHEPIVVQVKQIGTIEEPVFHIKTNQEVDETRVLSEIKRIFQWDVSLEMINKHFQGTDLQELFARFRGTPFVCDFNLYGSLMKTIIHQQLNMKFAYELSKRFAQTFGFELDGVWFYPTPEIVSKLSVDELRALQFSQRKAEYVIDTSRLIIEGALNLTQFKEKDDEEVISELTRVRGIGSWTAECFLMFGLGRLDLFPVKDIGIQNGLKKLFGLEEKPTIPFMEEISMEWKPYRTYASLYIWENIEVK